jgi:hypothetical protein
MAVRLTEPLDITICRLRSRGSSSLPFNQDPSRDPDLALFLTLASAKPLAEPTLQSEEALAISDRSGEERVQQEYRDCNAIIGRRNRTARSYLPSMPTCLDAYPPSAPTCLQCLITPLDIALLACPHALNKDDRNAILLFFLVPLSFIVVYRLCALNLPRLPPSPMTLSK